MKKTFFTLGSVIFLVSCSPKTAEVTTTPAVSEPMTFPNETVSTGFALYGSECTQCHKAKTVNKYSREEWNKILPNMAQKAKIDDGQEAAVDAYINWELAK